MSELSQIAEQLADSIAHLLITDPDDQYEYDNETNDLRSMVAGQILLAMDQATAEKDKEILARDRHIVSLSHQANAMEAEITRLRTERDLLAKTDTTKLPEWIAGYEAIQAENLQYKERNYDLRMEVERLRTWPAKQAIQIQELMQANWDATRKCSQLSVKVDALEKLLGELRHVGPTFNNFEKQPDCFPDCPACARDRLKEGK